MRSILDISVKTGLGERCYLLCKGSTLGEGLRGPKGLEGEPGFAPLCCEDHCAVKRKYRYVRDLPVKQVLFQQIGCKVINTQIRK